jgi:hypothetical protein
MKKIELKNWKNTTLNQIKRYTCVPAGYEWMIKYANKKNAIYDPLTYDFQDFFDLKENNGFGTVYNEINEYLNKKKDDINDLLNNVKFKSYEVSEKGFLQRQEDIKSLILKNNPCILPVIVTQLDKIDFHIMPIIKIENNQYTFLRHNFDGVIKTDIITFDSIKKTFLSNYGGNDLAYYKIS